MRKGIGASDTFSLFIAPQDLRCGVIDKLEFVTLLLFMKMAFSVYHFLLPMIFSARSESFARSLSAFLFFSEIFEAPYRLLIAI